MKITLCGSARFEEEFKSTNKYLTLCGHMIYSLACMPSDNGGKDWYTESEKQILDLVHLAKIEESDVIVVVGDGYVGESTIREINWANVRNKLVVFAEHHRRNSVEETCYAINAKLGGRTFLNFKNCND